MAMRDIEKMAMMSIDKPMMEPMARLVDMHYEEWPQYEISSLALMQQMEQFPHINFILLFDIIMAGGIE